MSETRVEGSHFDHLRLGRVVYDFPQLIHNILPICDKELTVKTSPIEKEVSIKSTSHDLPRPLPADAVAQTVCNHVNNINTVESYEALEDQENTNKNEDIIVVKSVKQQVGSMHQSPMPKDPHAIQIQPITLGIEAAQKIAISSSDHLYVDQGWKEARTDANDWFLKDCLGEKDSAKTQHVNQSETYTTESGNMVAGNNNAKEMMVEKEMQDGEGGGKEEMGRLCKGRNVGNGEKEVREGEERKQVLEYDGICREEGGWSGYSRNIQKGKKVEVCMDDKEKNKDDIDKKYENDRKDVVEKQVGILEEMMKMGKEEKRAIYNGIRTGRKGEYMTEEQGVQGEDNNKCKSEIVSLYSLKGKGSKTDLIADSLDNNASKSDDTSHNPKMLPEQNSRSQMSEEMMQLQRQVDESNQFIGMLQDEINALVCKRDHLESLEVLQAQFCIVKWLISGGVSMLALWLAWGRDWRLLYLMWSQDQL